MAEVWKDIPDYEGLYQASSYGRIKRLPRIAYKKDGKVHRSFKEVITEGTITYCSIGLVGRLVRVSKNGVSKKMTVHRLVASAFLGKSDLTVNHIDGNRLNNHIENLEWCSLAENIRKGFETGLFKNNCRSVELISKVTGEVIKCKTIGEAQKIMNKNNTYIWERYKNNKFENKEWKWRLGTWR